MVNRYRKIKGDSVKIMHLDTEVLIEKFASAISYGYCYEEFINKGKEVILNYSYNDYRSEIRSLRKKVYDVLCDLGMFDDDDYKKIEELNDGTRKDIK